MAETPEKLAAKRLESLVQVIDSGTVVEDLKAEAGVTELTERNFKQIELNMKRKIDDLAGHHEDKGMDNMAARDKKRHKALKAALDENKVDPKSYLGELFRQAMKGD